ncbi:hypothetical protein D3C71_1881030 [compost metagenome]
MAGQFGLKVFRPRLFDTQGDGIGQDALEALHRHGRFVDDVEAVLLGGFEIEPEAVDLVHHLAALHGGGAHQHGEDDADHHHGGRRDGG